MKRILVAGELNADLILTGLPSLPVLGRELVGTGFAMVLGSSSAITAARLATLGAENADFAVDFAGLVGDDDIGRFVRAQIAGYGVHDTAVEVVDTPTGVTISLPVAGDRALATYPGAIAVFDGAALTAERLAGYTHLHVGAFFLQTGLQPQLARIFGLARSLGVTTSLDVGWDPEERWMRNPWLAPALAEVDDFIINEDECAALAEDAAALKALVSGTLWVKQGGRGASAYVMRDGVLHVSQVPAFSVTPVDTTGAGDAFNAGAIYTLRILGGTIDDGLRFGAACGAQATLHLGGATAAPTERALREWMNERE